MSWLFFGRSTMAEHVVVTTDSEIDAALEIAKLHDTDTVARSVEHVPALNLLIVGLSNGRRLLLPVEDLQGLDHATHEQFQNYEMLGGGTGISFPDRSEERRVGKECRSRWAPYH